MSARDQSIGVGVAVAVAVMLFVGIGLLRFEAAGGITCDAPLRGAEPKERATQGYLVNREKEACDAKSGSRIAIGGLAGLVFLVVGVASVVAPLSQFERMAFSGEDPEEVYQPS